MSIRFEQKAKSGIPAYIKPETAELWQSQKKYIESQNSINNWVYKIQWPDFLNEKKIETPEKLGGWHERAVIKDAPNSIKIDMPVIWVKKENLRDIMLFFKEDTSFSYNVLTDLTAVDLLNSPDSEDIKNNQDKRFQVRYILRSLKNKGALIRIIVSVSDEEEVPSLCDVWVGANWPEREVYDLMGIKFSNHPNLKRILMPDNYKGHPLRKDFPLKGLGEDYLIEDLLKEHSLSD
ncbi:MAG: NADH-quinone oxidoreductase subunit C [Spirochaetia bacterium]|nr:NADH-quinone oxidoreductase subunit C [Spirochaetia bacterium]